MNDNATQFPMLLLFTLLALVAVLLLAWLAIRVLAKLHTGDSGGTRAVKVLQSVAVGNRERLVLIEYKGKNILLGVSAGGISVIDGDSDNELNTDSSTWPTSLTKPP